MRFALFAHHFATRTFLRLKDAKVSSAISSLLAMGSGMNY